MKVKHLLKKDIKEDINHTKILKEVLMSNFLIITVYEIISIPLIQYIFEVIKNDFNSNTLIPFENNSKFFFSTIQWADENLIIVVMSLIFTWFLILFIFKFAELLYSFNLVKEYINYWTRKELFTWEFWAKLLLTFFIIWILILFLYPIFWILLIVMIIIVKSKEMETEKQEKKK